MTHVNILNTLALTVPCPQCGRILRNVHKRKGFAHEIACQCGAIISFLCAANDSPVVKTSEQMIP